MAKRKVSLEKLKIADECEKISRDFMHEIPNMLNTLKITDPYKAIQAWKEITLFSAAQKGKDESAEAPTTINITLNPASQKQETEDADFIDISNQQKIEGKK